MIPLPPEAPSDVRQAILEALKSHENDPHYTIYDDGRRFLRAQGFVPEAVVQHVVEYLEDGCRLYLLQGPNIKGIKYQCCLRYDEGLDVHVKLTPLDDGSGGFRVMLGFHRHNTGYEPLPC